MFRGSKYLEGFDVVRSKNRNNAYDVVRHDHFRFTALNAVPGHWAPNRTGTHFVAVVALHNFEEDRLAFYYDLSASSRYTEDEWHGRRNRIV